VGSTGGFDFVNYVFPGVVAMSAATLAIFTAISIVRDPRVRVPAMLVAPIPRSSLVIGKTAFGATVAAAQAPSCWSWLA
jgi:ABC-2 type transport system permease protein